MAISLENLISNSNNFKTILNSLFNGASFRLCVENGEDFLIEREKKGFKIIPFLPGYAPDFMVVLPEDVLNQIFSSSVENCEAGDFLVKSAEILTSDENKNRIDFKLYAEFLKLTLHGYLKILPLGGRRLWKILKLNGMDSLSKIRKKLATFTNR